MKPVYGIWNCLQLEPRLQRPAPLRGAALATSLRAITACTVILETVCLDVGLPGKRTTEKALEEYYN